RATCRRAGTRRTESARPRGRASSGWERSTCLDLPIDDLRLHPPPLSGEHAAGSPIVEGFGCDHPQRGRTTMPPVPAPLGHSQPPPARPTPGPFARPPRVLILTAPVGEGHDLPARVLAQALEADAVPEVVDTLPLLGSMVEGVAARAMRTTLDGRGMGWVFDLEYALVARFAPTRVRGRSGLHTASARRLGAAVRQHAPDVVVSTYPISSEVLGHLRLRRRLDVPVCSVITDLAGLRYWAHPGVDLHLIAYPES